MTGLGRVPTRVFTFSVEITALIDKRERERERERRSTLRDPQETVRINLERFANQRRLRLCGSVEGVRK